MTDLRTTAIKAMARAVVQRQMPSYEVEEWIHTHPAGWETVLEEQTIAFDAQNGIVRVVPPTPSIEMLRSEGVDQQVDDDIYLGANFIAMARAGDLTKPRE